MLRIASHSRNIQHMDALAQAQAHVLAQPNTAHSAMNGSRGKQQVLSHSQHSQSQVQARQQAQAQARSRLPSSQKGSIRSINQKAHPDVRETSNSSGNFLGSCQKNLNEKSGKVKEGGDGGGGSGGDIGGSGDGGGGQDQLRAADCVFEMV